jgi:anti-sigma factor RsiW
MPNGHLDDDTLERYVKKQIRDSRSAEIEEHLLVCPYCQRRCAEEEKLANDIRRAFGTNDPPLD